MKQFFFEKKNQKTSIRWSVDDGRQLTVYELNDGASDLDLLTRFYDGLYIDGFAEPDERESLANMHDYLVRKRDGWYGKNNYHILLVLDAKRVIAASISDYFVEPNCGVIEFIVVDGAVRKSGLGRQLHDATVDLLRHDADVAGLAPLGAILIEMDDPSAAVSAPAAFDPVQRAAVWDRWGYRRLAFPYVQPALSAAQQPVECLLLAAKPLTPALADGFPATLVRRFIEAYCRWAMRIDQPDDVAAFQAMAQHLAKVPHVPLIHLVDRSDPKAVV